MANNSNNMCLSTQDLAVGYSKKLPPLHQNINVKVEAGQLTCLLGPNGAGKSTLIRTLSGFMKPISGQVWYGNKRIEEISEIDRAKKVGVVLTERINEPNLNVFDLVALGRTPYTGFFGRLTKNDVELVHKAIEDVGLHGYAKKHVDKISDGERQKAMIAKALVQETPFIILDEPAAFLDLPAKIEIMHLLHRLSSELKRGILLSTHDLEMALQIADKIWLLAQGKTLTTGIPEDLLLSNDFHTFFEKDGIVFDNYAGTFKYTIVKNKTIAVRGNGLAHLWATKALNRVGYNVVENCNLMVNVEPDNNTHNHCYAVYKNQQLIASCKNIEELLSVVVTCE